MFAANMIQAQETASLTLEIKNMNNRKGELRIAIFNSEQTFLTTPIKAVSFDLSTYEGNTFVIQDLPVGQYAVSVLQDENKNGSLDFGQMGPEEGYGFSNNPPAHYGPAKYEQTVFELASPKEMTIILL